MKQRNSPQKKEHKETIARDLTNIDISKRSHPKFRNMTIRILAGVENRLESLSAELEVEASQDEIKNAITELHSRINAMVAWYGEPSIMPMVNKRKPE